MSTQMRRRLEELGLAFGLMTRLPLPAFEVRTEATMASAFWAFPITGLVLGGLAAAGSSSVLTLGFGAPFAALTAVAILVAATGALHEDGLADFWDGVGGGRTVERRLEIMKDSRIGTYGVLALMLTLGLLATVLAEIFSRSTMVQHWLILSLAAAIARCGICLPLAALKPACEDGLGHSFGRPSNTVLLTTLAGTLAVTIFFLGWAGVAAIFSGGLGAAVMTYLAARFIGGTTGDVFGAVITTTFVGALIGARLAL